MPYCRAWRERSTTREARHARTKEGVSPTQTTRVAKRFDSCLDFATQRKKAVSRSPPPETLSDSDRQDRNRRNEGSDPSRHDPQRRNRRPLSRERHDTQTAARRNDRQAKRNEPTSNPMLRADRTTQHPNTSPKTRTTSQRPRTTSRRTRQRSHDKHQNRTGTF